MNTQSSRSTNPSIPGGVYAPPAFQTSPSACKRVMAVWLTREDNHLFAFAYAAWHTDPRRKLLTLDSFTLDYYDYAKDKESFVSGRLGAWLSTLLERALRLEVGAIWILDTPAAQEVYPEAALDLMRAVETMVNPPLLVHELSAGKHAANELAGLVVQRRREDTGKGQGAPVSVYFTWVGSTWPALKLEPGYTREEAARAWLEGVSFAAYALDEQIRFSPSYTGITSMRRYVAAAEARRGAPFGRLSLERLGEVVAHKPTYLQWRSRFNAHDLSAYWVYSPRHNAEMTSAAYIPVHVYDRNWSFVTAAREVPIGEPVATAEYVASNPGYYHLLSATPPPDWPELAPGPFHIRDAAEGATHWPGTALHDLWAWEPQIRQARKLGWHCEVEYGWQWPNRYDLRAWQQALYAARNDARGTRALDPFAASVAEKIIKSVGVAAIGRLGQRGGRAVMRLPRAREMGAAILSRHVDAEGELTGFADVSTDATGRDDMYWPHWWATIISNANERTLAAIYDYAREDTLLGYVDGIYTLEPHPQLAGDPSKPGAWRYKGLIYVPVSDLDRLDTLSPYELVRAFGRYASVSSALRRPAEEDEPVAASLEGSEDE